MVFVANESIEIIPLPQTAGTAKHCVDLSRTECFPTEKQFFQRVFRILQKHRMGMIRHYHRGDQDKTFAVKMAKHSIDYVRAIWVPQDT